MYTDSTGVSSIEMIVAHNGGVLAEDLEVLQFGKIPPTGELVKYEFHRG